MILTHSIKCSYRKITVLKRYILTQIVAIELILRTLITRINSTPSDCVLKTYYKSNNNRYRYGSQKYFLNIFLACKCTLMFIIALACILTIYS